MLRALCAPFSAQRYSKTLKRARRLETLWMRLPSIPDRRGDPPDLLLRGELLAAMDALRFAVHDDDVLIDRRRRLRGLRLWRVLRRAVSGLTEIATCRDHQASRYGNISQ